ncbi:MAG: MFS transporter [Clostridia bacterium]|nr:MFS transporter [Clostridia bacterium]MBN2881895.1 MFS transporter [Clostridia bacterium]
MTKTNLTYKVTMKACYLGFLVQATVINLTPVLFIPLREQFSLSFGQLGLLVLINFITQVTVDILFSHTVDRHGYRPFLTIAHIFVAAGFIFFAISPLFMKNPYVGFIMGTFLFSSGGGLLELLLSPTVNAIPSESKSASMSLVHSFYAWGQMGVIILTTLFLFIFGRQSWPFIMILWAVPPALNALLFSRVPFGPAVPEEHREGILKHIKNRFFIAAVFAIAFGGASELVISQWSSAFMEKVMYIPKALGDISGMAMFALMLGIGRLLHGKYGKHLSLYTLMITGTIAAFLCYLIVALSPYDILSLLACAISGLAVSLLWPGILVLSAERFPFAGTWLFAFLAAGGDIGASVGPWAMGVIADNAVKVSFIADIAYRLGLNAEQVGMRTGLLFSALFPLGVMICLLYMKSSKPL